MMVECVIDENDPLYECLQKSPMVEDLNTQNEIQVINLYDIFIFSTFFYVSYSIFVVLLFWDIMCCLSGDGNGIITSLLIHLYVVLSPLYLFLQMGKLGKLFSI